MRKAILTFLAIVTITFSSAQKELLQSGPMVGYSTMKEVLLWAQTKKEAKVHFEYWNKKEPSKKFKSDQVVTSKDKAFIARILADELEPSNQYGYALYINNKKLTGLII